METEVSLASSQELSTCTYPEPNKSSPQHSIIYIYIYIGCPRRIVPEFRRVFLMLKHADKNPKEL
jgi:hypothetical protein